MSIVVRNDKWLIEKDFLGFTPRDAMLFPILVCIAFVPLKADALLEPF